MTRKEIKFIINDLPEDVQRYINNEAIVCMLIGVVFGALNVILWNIIVK